MYLKVVFSGAVDADENISFQYNLDYPTLPGTDFTCDNVFKTERLDAGEVEIGLNGISQAEFFEDALIEDHSVRFSVIRVSNAVFIKAKNGSRIYDYSTDSSAVSFEEVEGPFENNAIHEIIFTPRQYVYPALMQRDFLITEDDYFLITEDNKKIRL